MTTALRKAICFGTAGTLDNNPGNQQSVMYYDPGSNSYPNLNIIRDSTTRWVRIWVDLYTLWPTQASFNTTLRDNLDYQIAAAKNYGCGVILVVNQRLPKWINGSDDPYMMPSNTELDGPWAYAISLLASRYGATNTNRPYSGLSLVDVLEFCNEPNQTWHTGGGDLVGTVATLFKRAKQIAISLKGFPIMAGPATSDLAPDHLRDGNDYYNFTVGVLQRLAGNGFYNLGSDACCMWTQHNYSDLVHDHGPDTAALDRTTYMTGSPQYDRYHVRSGITAVTLGTYGWKGWPNGDANSPRLWLTEGAAKREETAGAWNFAATDTATFESYQAWLLQRNLSRMNDATTGLGVEMMAYYLAVTASGYDCGLFRTDLVPRSSYSNVWRPFPGRA